MLTQQHHLSTTLENEQQQEAPPIEVIDLFTSEESTQGDCAETIMSNGDYDYSERAFQFGGKSSFWSDLNLADAHGAPPQHEELINRNVKIIEEHIVDVMRWRKAELEQQLESIKKRPKRKTCMQTDSEQDTCLQQTPISEGNSDVTRNSITTSNTKSTLETARTQSTVASNGVNTVPTSRTGRVTQTPAHNGGRKSNGGESWEKVKTKCACDAKDGVGCSILSEENEERKCLPERAKAELVLFVTTIASRYNSVLYHNFEHASHVSACVHQLIMMLKEDTDTADGISRRSSVLTSSSSISGNSSSAFASVNNDMSTNCCSFISTNPMVHLALVLTALIHDVEHQGVGNKQLVNENDPLALKYKGKSVAENNSLDVSASLLQHDAFHHLRQSMFGECEDISKYFSLGDVNDTLVYNVIERNLEALKSLFHQISHDVIMATDISCPLRLEKGKLKWMQAFEGGSDSSDGTDNNSSALLEWQCGSSQNISESEIRSLDRSNRRYSFPQVKQVKNFRRRSHPHELDMPTEFIADPFPDLTKIRTPSERNFCWTEKLNMNGSTQISCPLCHTSCTRNEAFTCSGYLRGSSVLEQMIQAADVGHTMQSWPVFKKWNEKLYNELWEAKCSKRGPDCLGHWFEGQISFFDNYIFPLAERLKQCGVFGELGSIFYENACANRQLWIDEGHNLCQEMHRKASYGTS